MDMDLSHLSEKEREAILQVIKRDEDLRRKEEQRLHRLKAELHWLRKRGALKSGFDPEHSCIRCRAELGKLLNRGAVCPGCQGRVCKSCRVQSPEDEEDWVCVVCHKQMEIQAASGEWMNEFIRRPSRRRDNKVFVPPSDVVKHSIRRSWTVAEGYRRGLEGTAKEKSSFIQSVSKQPLPKNLSPKRPSPKSSSPKSTHSVSSFSHTSSPHPQAYKSANGKSGIQSMSLNKGDITVSPNMEPNQLTFNGNTSQTTNKGSPIPVPIPRTTPSPIPPPGSAFLECETQHVDDENTSRSSSPYDALRLTPSPRHLSSSPSLRDSHSIPSPVLPPDLGNGTNSPIPSPRHCSSPLQRQSVISECERTSGNESPDTIFTHQSQYLVHKEVIHKPGDVFDSGYDNQGSPRTSRSSEHSRQSSGISTSHTDSRDQIADSASGSDGSDSEDLETSGVIFHKVTLRKRKENTQKGKHSSTVPSHTKWSRSHPGELQNRKEIRSWPAEDMMISSETTQQAKSTMGRRPLKAGMSNTFDGKTISIPQISISDITELNPSGRSSYGSHGTNSDRESVPEEDIDRIVALHKTRSSLSSFGTRSDSMTSVYSAAGGGRYGTVVVRGEVLFSLSYNYKAGALEIMVKCCRDLAAVDVKRNRSDPYVKIYLLPDKSKSGKRKTKVKKHTLNPTFEEMLKFNVTISELETRTLWLTVWHSDMFGRNDFLGEVMLPLGYDVFDDPSPKWYPLQERLGPPEELVTYKGELNLSLTYMPPDVTTQKKGKQVKGSLHVLIKDARNLTAVRTNGTSDPFCKSYLLPDKGKASKQKTPVIKKNCNPRWNHTFVYEDVSLDDLRERCLELTVWDYDRLTSNDFLGGVRLSLGTGKYQGKEVDWLDSHGEEVALWQSMLERPNTWVEGTLLLQPSMEKRS